SHPTISNIQVAFTGMITELETYFKPNSSHPVASAIYEKLKEYWNHYFNIHSAIPAVLDSRSKLTNFSSDQAKLSSSKSYFDKVRVRHQQNKPPKTPLEELNNYLELPPEENTDPLSWWKIYQARYPILSRLARNYLTIQATSITEGLGLGQTEDMVVENT
ncbi:13758_t:CDS:2, partial [Dentiscutata erythropus]